MISIHEAKSLAETKLLKEEGIAGIGISHSSPKKIRVYVESEEMAKKIPERLASHKTEVVVTGRFQIMPLFQDYGMEYKIKGYTGKYRPALGGVSIGHVDITAGTLGMVVRDIVSDRRVILSNCHVLAHSGLAEIGDPIIQPGAWDEGKDPDDRIATLTRFIEIKPPPEKNYVDAAIATPINDSDVSDDIIDIGKPAGAMGARVKMEVCKVGRTTQYTEGTIQDVNATIKIFGYPIIPEGYAIFSDQIITDYMAMGGDSGSILLDKSTKRAVGLLFAGSRSSTAFNKIEHVIRMLNINIEGGYVAAGFPFAMLLMTVPMIYDLFKH